jgi:hypothetical protein
MMEAIRSYETSALTRATCLHIPEDGFIPSHHLENLKSYILRTDLEIINRARLCLNISQFNVYSYACGVVFIWSNCMCT